MPAPLRSLAWSCTVVAWVVRHTIVTVFAPHIGLRIRVAFNGRITSLTLVMLYQQLGALNVAKIL